jgi:hypothetical protein
MQQLKVKLDALKQAVTKELDDTRKHANAVLDQMQQRMQNMDDYGALPEVRASELDAKFQELNSHFAQQQLIAVINDLLRRFEEQGYQNLLRRMAQMAKPKPPEPYDPTEDGGKHINERRAEYVVARKLPIQFEKALLSDESDVERYLELMREALMSAIKQGKQVQV